MLLCTPAPSFWYAHTHTRFSPRLCSYAHLGFPRAHACALCRGSLCALQPQHRRAAEIEEPCRLLGGWGSGWGTAESR